MSNQTIVEQNPSPCFFTFVGGSYNWVGTKDREQIATIKSTLKNASIEVIIFRPFYEAACGNGDNIYFNLLVSSSQFPAPNLKAILLGLSFIIEVNAVSPVNPDWAQWLIDGRNQFETSP
ncbi:MULTISPECIES: hypothetical protein [unclassified Acidiphilium]|jgi:hypothetical protein|uniref:hypothetical protein n=1 Tax=Acidiphilium TaxID=522 RepID=UPI00110F77A9|nr:MULTISPECIES: hypothetical protein [unclassified Acidiphilium]